MGARVIGYIGDTIILSMKAIEALSQVQDELREQGLSLKIYDAYRPQKAVDHFIRWAGIPSDTVQKRNYYPKLDKPRLFDLGYISARSGHTRGSTVDLTIVSMTDGSELDMGGTYDYFGERSHHSFSGITRKQLDNRLLLKQVMEKYGFKAYSKEWWHYTLHNEPFATTYFDFDIK